MSDLHDRLADLADDAPVVAEPGDLWRRGRRHRTRHLLATGAAATALAAVVALGATVGLQRTQAVPEPAAPVGTALVLPDTVFGPPEWLGLLGTVGEGDRPGPLVAVAGADLGGWTGTSVGYVAVTAGQQYRVLDLPDATPGLEPALSPDGRYVAYAVADGVAAYDTETGDVDRIALVLDVWGVTWLGDTVLVQGATGVAAWTMGQDAPVAVDDPRGAAASLSPGQSASPLAVGIGAREVLVLRTPADLTGAPAITIDRKLVGGVRVSPDGTRLAAVVRAEGGGSELAVGELTPGTTTLTSVPGSAPVDGDLVGWRDDDTVVTTALSYAGELTSVDVDTGRHRSLVTSSSPSGYTFEVAAEALTAPVVPGQAPPRPPDPRWVAGGAAVLGAGLWLALAWWRGRRRVRG